ncbi:MAG TPA: TetR/AcrR family transcriptional regulator [Polyangiaceae bacterium]|nr:TetR/AcrR family transcriptional regulator [Polyangiaceae bacterium]
MARKADPTIRGRLLAAARAEFSDHGLDGARISTITSRAGVSKGAFYLHFRTKEHAFEEVVSDFFGSIYGRMEEQDRLLGASEDVDLVTIREQLLERDVELFEYLWDQRAFALILFEGAGSSRHCHLIDAFAVRVQEQIERMLEIDRRYGRVRAQVDIRTSAAFIAGGFDRYARILLSGSTKPDIRADLMQLQDFVTFGLLPLELHRDAMRGSTHSSPPSHDRVRPAVPFERPTLSLEPTPEQSGEYLRSPAALSEVASGAKS